jgi:hypothetical protein
VAIFVLLRAPNTTIKVSLWNCGFEHENRDHLKLMNLMRGFMWLCPVMYKLLLFQVALLLLPERSTRQATGSVSPYE